LTGWVAYSAGGHRLLGITASEKVAGIVYVGTAKEMPADRKRPDIDAIVTRWIVGSAQSDRGDWR
jgi:hypothetical protein